MKEFSASDNRIKLVSSDGLPTGWLGKNHACHVLSSHAKGSCLLFVDADVRLSGNIIANSAAFANKYHLGLLSIFPTQIMVTAGERVTVPNMNYILMTLLPLVLVRVSKHHSLAAANGQFMLFNAAKYHEIAPHEKMKDNKVEDIAIARWFKKNNIPVACLAGDGDIRCRMYHGFSEAVEGFSKNVISFFGNSFSLAIIFWLSGTFGIVIVGLELTLLPVLFYLFTLLATRIMVSLASRQNILLNLLLLVPQQLAMGLFILRAFINKFKKQFQWKGRSIS